ncbi:hypothetical protein EDD21DRAFT_49526 [Dissophora ornata]|nr:hypothetical protein EDD21DRAFT_49526 [Dissophora ornata]
MDSTDSPQFPSPLVMLIKFPNLEVLSSRYRRKQTSFTTDTHTLKDMLRNGDILPHSLRLRRWDVFHPYMTKDDVTGFKQILDAITVVGLEAAAELKKESKRPLGVILDICLCSGSREVSPTDSTTAGTGLQAGTQSVVHVGGGMHWAPAAGVQLSPAGDQGVAPPSAETTAPAQPCANIVWVLEKCRVCEASQDRCWQCVGQCKACGAARAPPSINHQTALERERAKQIPFSSSSSSSSGTVSQLPATGSGAIASDTVVNGRPRTPPGSISLSQLSNPLMGVRSAYLSTHQSARYELLQAAYAASNSGVGSVFAPQPVAVPATLTRPPEFSFFD